MHRICKALASRAAGRSGMTLTEVLLGLAVFLTGSVSIVGLFAAASVLHAEASNRRTAAFIAEELLAEAQGMRFSEVFAKTSFEADLGGNTIQVVATTPSAGSPVAGFDSYPVRDIFLDPDRDLVRNEGPLLIDREWIYAERGVASFFNCARERWGTSGEGAHDPGDYVLQPRTWFYVLDASVDDAALELEVVGRPHELPADAVGANDGAPLQGYVVVDREWASYTGRGDVGGNDVFTIGERGIGGTERVGHKWGTPVTVAREHASYPGFYYTVQYYPVNAKGAEARIIVSVAYKTGTMFRAWFLEGNYAPLSR